MTYKSGLSRQNLQIEYLGLGYRYPETDRHKSFGFEGKTRHDDEVAVDTSLQNQQRN